MKWTNVEDANPPTPIGDIFSHKQYLVKIKGTPTIKKTGELLWPYRAYKFHGDSHPYTGGWEYEGVICWAEIK
jgi:hypothetical protein